MKIIRTIVVGIIILTAAAGSVSATTIALWTFQGPTGIPTLNPETGSGSVSLVNCTGGWDFASAGSQGTSSDPLLLGNKAYYTTSYAAQAAGNRSYGVQFNAPTTGYRQIQVRWDSRATNTASRYLRFQYTVNGTDWTDGQLLSTTTPSWQTGQSIDLTSVQGAADNPNFGFRFVAEFAPDKSTYAPVVQGSTYYPTGIVYYDMATVTGIVPEPGALLALMTGLVSLTGLSRRRRP